MQTQSQSNNHESIWFGLYVLGYIMVIAGTVVIVVRLSMWSQLEDVNLWTTLLIVFIVLKVIGWCLVICGRVRYRQSLIKRHRNQRVVVIHQNTQQFAQQPTAPGITPYPTSFGQQPAQSNVYGAGFSNPAVVDPPPAYDAKSYAA